MEILSLCFKNIAMEAAKSASVSNYSWPRNGLGFKVNMDGFHNQQHLQMQKKEATEFVKNVHWEWKA